MARIKRTVIEGEEIVEVDMDPKDILNDPLLNKGTAFTEEERLSLGLQGFLPYHVSTVEEQVQRRYANFCQRKTELERYLFLTALQGRNETLFFRLLSHYPEEMLPFIYTPTVGDASLQYSYIYNQNRGIYLSYPLKDKMEEIVAAIPRQRVDVIVVTDGGRVLGLGDLGVGGMAIPIGKLALYTLFGGIHPAHTLPVLLDVGTDNPHLLNDPLYLGWRHERIKGKEYEHFIDRFVKIMTKRFPHVLIQWEDFSKQNAQPLLDRYQDQCCCFNDDIQGTAGVVTAGIFAALKGMDSDLKTQRVVIYGGGSAGIGIARLIVCAMQKEGIDEEQAKAQIFIVGREGLAHTQSEGLDALKKQFMQKHEALLGWQVKDFKHITLQEVVRHAKATVLIGTSAQAGAFTEDVVVNMKKHVARPVIFPLSNPTSKSEATAEDLIKWTKGQALVATGSPFPPVEYEGVKHVVGQCNNVFIFPGVGLGIIASKARRVTDQMFLKAAETLSTFAPILHHPYGSLFPSIKQLAVISRAIAVGVGKMAVAEGICDDPPANMEKAVEEAFWKPRYARVKKKQ